MDSATVCPSESYASTALRHTGKFEIKFAVQRRQLRKEHPDSKYVMILVKYVKEYAVQFRNWVVLISVDDKATIPIGEPGAPVSTGVRDHHRSLVPSSAFVGALDHDFHVYGIIPSVCLIIDVPESSSDSFFGGQVYVANKNKITQSSNALRHSTEVSEILLHEQCSDNSAVSLGKSVLIMLSDGGPDHRLVYGSVQIALLCLFILICS